MDIGIVVLRLIHISCGVFWAGTLIFVATLLEPSVRAAGPGGAGVMQALIRRHYLNIMPAVAGLTILSGVDLLRRASAGFTPEWFTAPNGITLTVGSSAAVIAFVIGVGIMRPAALRLRRLSQVTGNAEDDTVEATRQSAIEGLRHRTMIAGRWVAGWLIVAVVCMAIARYVG